MARSSTPASWNTYAGDVAPVPQEGIYVVYTGASLTSHAFDRVRPGLGRWLVTLASWLFAISTMISWSYYGEQGVVFMLGAKWVRLYKAIYCLLIVVATSGFITTDQELDAFTSLGTGVMLFANIPIILIFSKQTMDKYHEYMGRLKSGQMQRTS
jgi:AGCS family alanine or glycine:cation symporter